MTPSGGRPPVGVLVMAYGTPRTYDEVEAFYTDVRRGRPPSPEQLADLQRRYAAVGGVSQLSVRTAEQVAGIQAAFNREDPGRYSCRYGAKHAAPSLEETIEVMAADGIEELVALVLAPHYSSGSVAEYLGRASAKAASLGLRITSIEDWHELPVLVELLAERVRDAFASIGAAPGDADTELLVSAHSLPLRIIEAGDGYDRRLEETGRLVAAASGVERWKVCWQSAGRTPEPWIGPDVLDVLRGLKAEGVTGAVVCPAGFVSDHLEVNYDLDIEAKGLADQLGLRFTRTASLNADERLCEGLAGLVREAVAAGADAGTAQEQ